MAAVSYGRLFGVVGGLLGVLAFFLPWVVFSTGLSDQVLRQSAFDFVHLLMQGIVLTPDPLPSQDVSGGEGFEIAFLIGVGGWSAFLAGSAISVFKPHGGVVMFVGIVVATAAASIMATEVLGVEYLGIPGLLRMDMDISVFVAFAASITAVVGIFLHRREIGA